MTIRSFMFIPGDSEKKLGKADDLGADALILDLEDAVAPSRKPMAREMVPAFMRDRPAGVRTSQLWVRINPLGTEYALTDLAAVVPMAPDGPAEVLQLSHYLDALEAQAGLPLGAIQILPVATETAKAPFALGDYASAELERLYGLTWGAEDLSSAIGASSNLGEDGEWTLTYRMVRSMTLLAAHAARVEAVETLYVDFKDPDGLRASSRAARSEGFSGRMAIHPAQIDIINESFTPSEDEVAFANRVIAAFQAEPDAGTVQLNGKMLDIPHLNQARRTIAVYERYNR
jgi:citrate lyase subunit beta / citryl-CoA lyase